jgi:hypothetical protein
MPHRQTLLRVSGATVLTASAVMLGAAFTPFATQTCAMCPDIGPGTTFVFPSYALAQGLDGRIVLATIVGLALFGLASLLDIRRRIASAAVLVAAITALALVTFEGVDATRRVVGADATIPPMELGPHGPIPYVPAHGFSAPAHLDAGFFLLVIAAMVAVSAAIMLVRTVEPTSGDSRDRIRARSRPSRIHG